LIKATILLQVVGVVKEVLGLVFLERERWSASIASRKRGFARVMRTSS
jgi:hypothetical protein